MTDKLELHEGTIDEAISQLSDKFAREVGVFADLFQYWRKPEVARAVVESLIDNDREAFNALLKPEVADPSPIDPQNGDLDPTQILLCYKMLLLLDKLGRMKVTKKQEICRLRTDLSPGERRRYLAIALQFPDAEIVVHERTPDGGSSILEGPVIPPGPFLEALKAEGLVTCVEDDTIASIDTEFGIFSGVKDMCQFTL